MPSAMTRRNRRCRSAIVSWNSVSTLVIPGTVSSGMHLVGIGGRELALQRVAARDRRRPVEHLLPVRDVARRRRLDEQPGVPGLAVGAGDDPALLLLGRRGEELPEHRVGLVEQILREVVRGVDEAGLEAPAHAVDHRSPLLLAPLFEGQQVDVEDLAHEVNATGAPPGAKTDGSPPVCRKTTSVPGRQRPSTALPSSPASPLPL